MESGGGKHIMGTIPARLFILISLEGDSMTDEVIRPFRIAVAEEVPDDPRGWLDCTRFPSAIANAAWDYDTDLDYMRERVSYRLLNKAMAGLIGQVAFISGGIISSDSKKISLAQREINVLRTRYIPHIDGGDTQCFVHVIGCENIYIVSGHVATDRSVPS